MTVTIAAATISAAAAIVLRDSAGRCEAADLSGLVSSPSLLADGRKQTMIRPTIFSIKPSIPHALLLFLSCARRAEKKVLNSIVTSARKMNIIAGAKSTLFISSPPRNKVRVYHFII